MQFDKRLREGVRRGQITCSVRIWMRPHVKVGGRYAMEEGEIEVDAILPIELADPLDDLDQPCYDMRALTRNLGFVTDVGGRTSHTAIVARSAASSRRSSASLRKRTWVAMSGRVMPKVPLSPQQRSLLRTFSPTSAFTVVSGSRSFIGLWQGSWKR